MRPPTAEGVLEEHSDFPAQLGVPEILQLNRDSHHMGILMTDDARGTLHGLLHVRTPEDVRIPYFIPQLYSTLRQPREDSVGANLRFKSPELVPVGRRQRAGGWL